MTRKCIIHCSKGNVCKDLTNISETAFASIKECASLTKNMAKTDEAIIKIIDDLPLTVNNGIHGMHQPCFNKISLLQVRLASYVEKGMQKRKHAPVITSQHIAKKLYNL